jgi:glucose-1-phosphate thymidylyltransferase
MAVVGIIPAAGYATRLQPLEGSKELLPVAGKPVMDHVLDRMLAGGCSELRVVTRPEKRDVIKHAEARGAHVVLAYPDTTAESFANGVEGLAADDIVLLGWPDTIWEPFDGYLPLVEAVETRVEVALGLFRIDPDDLRRSDVIRFGEDDEVEGIEIKPANPPSDWIWGCAAARARALANLGEAEWPGSYFDALLRERIPIAAIRLSDQWLDIGTHEALARLADPGFFVNHK